MEQSVLSNHQLFEVLAKEAMVAFIVFDQTDNHKCVYVNKLAVSMLEASNPEKINNFTVDQLFPDEENKSFRPLTSDLFQHEGLYQDILTRKQNDIKFVANIGVKKLELDDGEYLLLMLQDVTLQKKLQRELTSKQAEIQNAYQELLEQNKQLKALDVAKNRFIALTTHELRTPLSAMIGSAELLREKLYDTEEQKEEFIEMIYEQGLHLMDLVNDILDFAKIQAGKMDFYVGQKDLLPLVASTVEHFETIADQDEIQLILDAPEESYVCYFDDMRVKQVINNIVSNAIKYNNKGGKVTIKLEKLAGEIKLSVQDTGKGIPADLIDQVFNEFETLGKVANHQKGTGLGMPISKRLIEGMGGSIDLESVEGEGTCFWINIPTTKVLSEEEYRERLDSFDLAA